MQQNLGYQFFLFQCPNLPGLNCTIGHTCQNEVNVTHSWHIISLSLHGDVIITHCKTFKKSRFERYALVAWYHYSYFDTTDFRRGSVGRTWRIAMFLVLCTWLQIHNVNKYLCINKNARYRSQFWTHFHKIYMVGADLCEGELYRVWKNHLNRTTDVDENGSPNLFFRFNLDGMAQS